MLFQNPFFRASLSLILTLTFVVICLPAKAQKAGDTLRALFIGNSYTYTNNLPSLIDGLAASRGGKLIYSSSAPGGYTLAQHSVYIPTLDLIKKGNWDYVVLQEQSQYPSFPEAQVENSVYPYAHMLDSLVKKYNPCAKTVFYMTWGRKNGDAQNCANWTPVCTYQGMDSLLQKRYTYMAATNKALLSPIAQVWRYLRNTSPEIELYNADESHPSLAGSYAAACGFYAIFFKDDPEKCTYRAALTDKEAATLRKSARIIVYDSLQHIYGRLIQIKSDFELTVKDSVVNFINLSLNAERYQWVFGDGNFSFEKNPVHQYAKPGSYTVKAIAWRCKDSDTLKKIITLSWDTATKDTTTTDTSLYISHKQMPVSIKLYPNPAQDLIIISSTDGYPITSYIICDVSGRILTRNIGLHTTELKCPLQELKAGYYQVFIDRSGQTTVLPILKVQ